MAGALSNGEEIFDVLASNKLLSSLGIGIEEFLAKPGGIVQLRVRLEHGDDATAGETLLNTMDILASQVAQTDVHPTFLMCNILEVDHTENNVLIGHVTDVVNDSSILLGGEPGLTEVAIEFLYDRVAILREPSSSLLLRELEDSVVEVFP